MNRKPITIYAILGGSTSSKARPLIAAGQVTTRKARAAEQPKPQPAKRKSKKRRTVR